jgi:hypothetical protein
MSHNNGVVSTFGDELIFKYKDSPSCGDEGGVGDLNHTQHLVKPLMIITMFSLPKSYVSSMVNPNLSLGIQS